MRAAEELCCGSGRPLLDASVISHDHKAAPDRPPPAHARCRGLGASVAVWDARRLVAEAGRGCLDTFDQIPNRGCPNCGPDPAWSVTAGRRRRAGSDECDCVPWTARMGGYVLRSFFPRPRFERLRRIAVIRWISGLPQRLGLLPLITNVGTFKARTAAPNRGNAWPREGRARDACEPVARRPAHARTRGRRATGTRSPVTHVD